MKAYETASPTRVDQPQTGSIADSGRRLVSGRLGATLVLSNAFWGWAGPVLVMLFGGFLRFYRLSKPDAIVFDETYYVPDSNSILRHGVELNHVSKVNDFLLHGNPHFLEKSGELVAHPPLGKMMMAVGQWTFGLSPFGWRFSVALIGTVSILMTARIARRMTGSTMLGCVAGLLLALDGLELVLSRTAILDIFVMFWVLAAFGLLVIDRDRTKARLKAAADQTAYDESGPGLGIRWLRVGAGVCLGAAVASKWNGLWYLFAFAGLAISWDLGSRRAAGFRNWFPASLRHDWKWLPVWFVVAPFVVYTASWTGWFLNSTGYYRNWAAQHGNHTPIWSTIDSWWQYNHWMYQFGVGLTSFQSYKSNPVGWMVLARPISFYWSQPTKSTASEVLAMGTPAIWWGGSLALLFCLGWWLAGFIGDLVFGRLPKRDWRAGAVLLGVLAGWLPWIWYAWHDNRTEFYYYAVVFDPFLVIAITLCLGLIIGPAHAEQWRRALGTALTGVFLIAVVLNLAYIYPILTAEVIPYTAWLHRMWFHRWI